MTDSKAWDWENAEKDAWLSPSEESYYYAEKWIAEGRKSLLDLGCGLGRHSVFFHKKGFKVTACDLSEYGVNNLKEWQKKEGADFRAVVCDMKKLPFADNAFDCIYSYHVISHCDSKGIELILSEIRRVLKPGGEIFFDFSSKDSWGFTASGYPKIDENTFLAVGGVEDGIPHFCVNLEDIDRLMTGFKLNRIRHIDEKRTPTGRGGGTHYFIEAVTVKEEEKPDFSGIIGKTVSGKIDRPIGSAHPKHPDIIYNVNYGYVEGIMAGDGENQDVYLMGCDTPVEEFSGKVIGVYHRYNDIEDKWIVSADGKDYSDSEILKSIAFQERYFDGELFR